MLRILTKRELQIMNTLWHSNLSLSAKDIESKLPDISINTILAVLRKLLSENLIRTESVELSRSTLMRKYEPILQESSYLTATASDRALKEIVSAYIDDASTDKELDELESLIIQRRNDIDLKQ